MQTEIINFSDNIKQTVALPCYNAKNIGWIAMESLCRQDPTSFDWELIICEEPHEKMLGKDFFASYKDRLMEAGCRRILYISPEKWTPLPQKWRAIGIAAHRHSKSFLLHAADCYSPKGRLELSHELIEKGYDWIDYIKGYFYSIHQKKLVLYDAMTLKLKKRKRNLNMAFPTKYARKLPLSDKKRLIDKWLFNCIIPKKIYRVKELYPSLDTHGENNISKREDSFITPKPPYTVTTKKIEEIGLPKDITDRLCTL